MHITSYGDDLALETKEPGFYPRLLYDGSNRGFLMSDEDLFKLALYVQGHFKHTKLEQRIGSNHKGFKLPKNHFIFEAFNHKIVQLFESGLATKFINDALSQSGKDDEDGPVVLTIKHLGIGFKIVAFFLVISFIVFLLEFVPACYRRNVAGT